MIGLLHRVKHASVVVDNQCVGAIQQGVLILLGLERSDDSASAKGLAQRILRYRVFCDGHGKMKLNVPQIRAANRWFSLCTPVYPGSRYFQRRSTGAGERLYQAFIAAVAAHLCIDYLNYSKFSS